MNLQNTRFQYTEVSNVVLCDSSLSLASKGLYAMIYSYAGLPEFKLTLDRLHRSCASSAYELRKAWRELKAAGYLKHYYTTTDNGAFCHAYDIGYSAKACDGQMQYVHQLNRPNGDVHPQENDGNYTQIPNHLLRSSCLSLKLKGLYSILSYLFKIPNFQFRLKSLAALCKENAKALASSWLKLKLSGLLKQHRRPSGEHNRFDWTYDLLQQPDLETPYFTSHRADGSIVTSMVAQHAASTLCSQEQPTKINRNQTSLRKYIDKALKVLCQNKNMKIGGTPVPQENRIAAVSTLSADKLQAFAEQFRLPDQVRAPIPYIASALYKYATQKNQAKQENQDQPLSFFDIQWALNAHMHRIQKCENPSDNDLLLVAQYKNLLSNQMNLSPDDFQAQCTAIFENWKSMKQALNQPPYWGLKVLLFFTNPLRILQNFWRIFFFSSFLPILSAQIVLAYTYFQQVYRLLYIGNTSYGNQLNR